MTMSTSSAAHPRVSLQSSTTYASVRRFAILAAFVTLLIAPQAFAAVLEGTVMNRNTRRFLERATVRVLGTQLSALTDSQGRFRIAGLAPGDYVVTASYAGLGDATQTISVTDPVTQATFQLASEAIYEMGEKITVTGPQEGVAYAINQQRRAETTRTVVSVDAFIDQATGNPGEFLKSVPGIQMDYSQNEPQAIRVRGFDPNLTTVTMDGNEIATAASSGTNRAVQIDQLSMASIGAVEVYKAPIPSMSANSIGGVVNFLTKNAFQQAGRRISLQLGANVDGHTWFEEYPSVGHGEEAQRGVYPIGRVEYSNLFLDGRLGVFASAGRDHTNQLGSSVTHNLNYSGQVARPALVTLDNTTVRRGNVSFAPNRQLRERNDVSLNTDYKLTDAAALFLRSTYTYYHSTNRNHGFTLTPGALAAGHTATDYTTTNGTASQGTSIFDKYTRSWQISPGVNVRMGNWDMDFTYGHSESNNRYDNDDNFGSLSINLPGVSWSMITPLDTSTPTSISQLSGPSFYDLNNYRPNQGNLVSTAGEHRANHGGMVSTNVRRSTETKESVRFDVQRDFQGSRPFYLKAGLARNQAERTKRQTQKRWYWMGEDGIATADDNTAAGARLGRFAEPVPVTVGLSGFNLREPSYFCSTCFHSYWQANPQVLQENLAYGAQQEFTGYRFVDETVDAVYGMGSFAFGKLNVLTGLRIEKTGIEAVGHRVLPTSGTGPDVVDLQGKNPNSLEGILATYRRTTSEFDYTSDPFPYLHLKYEWLPNLQTRASYTEAIGRPNFTDILPSMTQNDEQMRITTNRTGITPQRSQNLDFSVEYYTKSAGEWTAGWFQRDVDDYISSATVAMTPALLDELNLGPEYSNYDVVTKTNLGSAKWSGFELSFRQQLRDWNFVPQILDGMEFFGNYTHLYKVEGDFGIASPGTKITTLANVAPTIVNAGASYLTPGGKFFVSLITNYQGVKSTQNLPPLSAAAQRLPQQEPYQFWNAELSYHLTNNVRLTAVGRNLTGERPTFSEAGIIRSVAQDTGQAWTFSLRMDL